MRIKKNICLIGLMGSGKSRVGRQLSASLNLPYLDLDGQISEAAGKTISEIFRDAGEEHFRTLESSALKAILAGSAQVISCGGGVVLRPENRRLLAQCHSFYLQASLESLVIRVKQGQDRPLLEGRDIPATLRQLLAEREPFYFACASHTIQRDGLESEEVVEQIAQLLDPGK